MFDFQNLHVYRKSKIAVNELHGLISNNNFKRTLNDQLGRASTSVLLNIAEGNSRFTKKDKRWFLVISRGSVFECVAVLDIMFSQKLISRPVFELHMNRLEEISRMLYAMIRKLEQ